MSDLLHAADTFAFLPLNPPGTGFTTTTTDTPGSDSPAPDHGLTELLQFPTQPSHHDALSGHLSIATSAPHAAEATLAPDPAATGPDPLHQLATQLHDASLPPDPTAASGQLTTDALATDPAPQTQWTSTDMFGHLPTNQYLSTAFTDLDGDGDPDMVVGMLDGTVKAFLNGTTGTEGAFSVWSGTRHFSAIDAGDMATPAFVDIDGDGDMDLVTGSRYDGLSVWRNGGVGTSGNFQAVNLATSRFADVGYTGGACDPTFVDIDGDGDMDMVMGAGDGTLKTYINGTTGTMGHYTLWGAGDPLAGLNAGGNNGGSTPAFIDLDGDGDLDLVTGARNGQFTCFMNGTTGTSGAFTPWSGTSPFGTLDVGIRSDPSFVDLDGDGDLDFVTTSFDFVIYAFENTAGAGNAPVFDFSQFTATSLATGQSVHLHLSAHDALLAAHQPLQVAHDALITAHDAFWFG